ncbi:MAG TPA: protein kinase [Blastocatellia bacterium]|nr:protein kinase [Blastocatellia bacterium]
MKPEHWKQIEALYHAALEREPDARATFLDAACAGDEELRREVASLLHYDSLPDRLIDVPALEIAARELALAPLSGATAQSAIPARISSYQLLAPLGHGGMGEVHLALDTRLNRKVAIKLLPAEFTTQPERVRRFAQEARAASALNHPNIITIHEIGKTDSTHYLITEYVEGETLRQRMNNAPEKRLRLTEALDLAAQIAAALAAAHEAGIVHRDIKPENVMVRRDGIVKVLDFGLAKLTETQAPPEEAQSPLTDDASTETGLVLGTPRYMSPEQARGERVDARTDLFSFGVMLYEMIEGHSPFAGATTSELIAAILRDEPAQVPEASPELQRIIQRALQKERTERYQTIDELLADVKKLQKRLIVDAERDDSPAEHRLPLTPAVNLAPKAAGAKAAVVERAAQISSGLWLTGLRGWRLAWLILILPAFVLFGLWYRTTGKRSIESVAVLPFINDSGNADVEYLSDGMTESLINNLARLPNLRVMARNSVFRYKGRSAGPHEVARALGVEAIVTGRILLRGDNLIISVELVDGRDETQLWGEQYSSRTADLLAAQAQIAGEIATQLQLTLTPAEQQQLVKPETSSPQAYEYLLRGRHFQDKGGTEDWKKAIEYYQQAVTADPGYALAWAELSGSYFSLSYKGLYDQNECLAKARWAADRALELDERLAEAHLALARIRLTDWNWKATEQEIRRALELNPGLGRARFFYSAYLSLTGQHEQAIAEARRARAPDPLSLTANHNLAYRYLLARRNDQAIEASQALIELDQNYPNARAMLGHAYEAKGMYAEAIAAYQEAIRLGDQSTDIQIYLGSALAGAGEREKARTILKQLEANKYTSPGALTALYLALDERERAFAALERAYAAHDNQLQFLRVSPQLDPLRNDPRFIDLMRRVGLSP